MEQITPSQASVAEVLAADRPAELDHAADDRAGDDDVVDRDVALASRLGLERRQLRDHVVAGERALETASSSSAAIEVRKPTAP